MTLPTPPHLKGSLSVTMPYSDVAQAYAVNVRNLFTPPAAKRRERGVGAATLSPWELAEQAEKLSPISNQLAVEAANKLAAQDTSERVEASNQLLAKALTDLTVSAHLFEAAEDAEVQRSSDRAARSERSVSEAPDELLQIIVGHGAVNSKRERAGTRASSDPEARVGLLETLEDTIDLISKRTATAGQSALTGLFGIGLVQVGQAAGLVGQSVAGVFGQAEKLSRLYALCRDFALKAYDSVLALLGPVVARAAGQQVLDWLAQVKEARFIGQFLEKIYQTQETQAALSAIVSNSKASGDKFTSATTELNQLGEQYSRQTALIEKLLKGMKFLGGIPAAILPYGTLLLAGAYIAITAYLVFNGADYLDAHRLTLLNRVRGIRQVIETNLG